MHTGVILGFWWHMGSSGHQESFKRGRRPQSGMADNWNSQTPDFAKSGNPRCCKAHHEQKAEGHDCIERLELQNPQFIKKQRQYQTRTTHKKTEKRNSQEPLTRTTHKKLTEKANHSRKPLTQTTHVFRLGRRPVPSGSRPS